MNDDTREPDERTPDPPEDPGLPAAGPVEEAARPRLHRGFAAMDRQKQRAIASKGGKASHEKGTGHEWSSESARAAGRRGGLAAHASRGQLAAPQPAEGEPERDPAART